MSDDQRIPRTKRYLNADYLIKTLRRRFEDVPDQRRAGSVTHSMVDTLMSAFAMFSLKEPSLLSFQERDDEPAIRRMFGLDTIPSDSQMRTILDGIDIESLNQAFADIFHELQRAGELKRWVFDRGHYLMAIDGTGHFCSTKICCDHCLVKKPSKGAIQYYHQAVAAVLTHPETGEVLPIAVEPIVKQDGETKNDCERNATKRLLKRVRALHPKLKIIVVEDGLASNAPHIADLKDVNMHFLLGAKPGDHVHLFDQVIEAGDRGKGKAVRTVSASAEKLIKSETQVITNLALNKSNEQVRVNFLQHHEYDEATGEVSNRFSWVSDMEIDRTRILLYQRGGRSRWRIENETFNTLKNQGYHYEHNYGHGKENLSTVLMLLMFLAFYVDQVQQACCPLFQAVLEKLKTRRKLWDHLRSHVRHFNFRSFADLWATVLTGAAKNQHPPPRHS
jgi:hypothetical protein